jgi:4-hydroxybenzoate polyprenyltransferase
MAFFRLVRFPNLFIVALTQSLLYLKLLRPALEEAGILPVFDHLHFALFAGVTVAITAAGYIVNDLIDYEVDLINRPEKIILHRHISFQTAYWLVGALVLSGFFTALFLAAYVGRLYLITLFPAALAGLFWYNAFLKRQALTGNIVIALYCAAAAAVLWLAEGPALRELARQAPALYVKTWSVFIWFLIFAFLATLFRELIKDIEDMKGDRSAHFRTAPILWGEERARRLALLLGTALLLFIGGYGYYYQQQFGLPALLYLSLAVGLPLLGTLGTLHRARHQAAYHRVSTLTKLVILTGLLLLLFV